MNFSTDAVKLNDNDRLAMQVAGIRTTLNGSYKNLIFTPFNTAATIEQFKECLTDFAFAIKLAAKEFVVVTGYDGSVPFDEEASGADIVAEELLKDPREERVRSVFDGARAGMTFIIDDMKASARAEASIPDPLAVTAMMKLNNGHNVVTGVNRFIERAPVEVMQGFVFAR